MDTRNRQRMQSMHRSRQWRLVSAWAGPQPPTFLCSSRLRCRHRPAAGLPACPLKLGQPCVSSRSGGGLAAPLCWAPTLAGRPVIPGGRGRGPPRPTGAAGSLRGRMRRRHPSPGRGYTAWGCCDTRRSGFEPKEGRCTVRWSAVAQRGEVKAFGSLGTGGWVAPGPRAAPGIPALGGGASGRGVSRREPPPVAGEGSGEGRGGGGGVTN